MSTVSWFNRHNKQPSWCWWSTSVRVLLNFPTKKSDHRKKKPLVRSRSGSTTCWIHFPLCIMVNGTALGLRRLLELRMHLVSLAHRRPALLQKHVHAAEPAAPNDIETDLQPQLMSTTHYSPDCQHRRVIARNCTADRNVLITAFVRRCVGVCTCISHLLLLNIEVATAWLALAGWQLNPSPSCFFPSNLLKWLKSCWPVRTGRVCARVSVLLHFCISVYMNVWIKHCCT